MSPTDLLVPTYCNMLRTLRGILTKAAEQGPADTDRLMAAQLAPDMLPLAAQIRFAAYQAQEAACRLRGVPIPASLDIVAAEGRGAADAPGTLAEAVARIEEALSFLDGLEDGTLDGDAMRAISLTLPGGLTFDMTATQFVRDWALPQFYFHIVTAYAILRHHGVSIGKADYVPHMFAYLRS